MNDVSGLTSRLEVTVHLVACWLVVCVDEANCPSGGLAAMELLAMTMRAEGMLSCRSLSFKGPGGVMIETY